MFAGASCRSSTKAQRAAQREVKRKAEAERETQARQDFNARARTPHRGALPALSARGRQAGRALARSALATSNGSFLDGYPALGAPHKVRGGSRRCRAQAGKATLVRPLRQESGTAPLQASSLAPRKSMWKDRLAGKPGDLLDIVHLRGRHATAAEAREAGYAFRESQAEAGREAQAHRVTGQERHGFNAAAAPWAEALCRRYLPLGVKRDGEWHARINIDGKNEYPLNIPLWGLWRGRWTLEGAGREQDTLFGAARSQLDAQRSLLERDGRFPNALARRRPHHCRLERPGTGDVAGPVGGHRRRPARYHPGGRPVRHRGRGAGRGAAPLSRPRPRPNTGSTPTSSPIRRRSAGAFCQRASSGTGNGARRTRSSTQAIAR